MAAAVPGAVRDWGAGGFAAPGRYRNRTSAGNLSDCGEERRAGTVFGAVFELWHRPAVHPGLAGAERPMPPIARRLRFARYWAEAIGTNCVSGRRSGFHPH